MGRIADYTTDVGTDKTGWMARGGCVPPKIRELPWLKDSTDVTEFEQGQLRAVCLACPVLSECSRYADAEHLTGGFWAGVHREHRRVREQSPDPRHAA